MRATILASLIALPLAAHAQGSTDVYLAPLQVSGARVTIGAPVNLTARTGYDNQPSFTQDSRSVLYTSIREDGQADIYRVDVDRRSAAQVTATPESEYSGTMIPQGGGRISVVRVERDSTQRLWAFDLDGGEPRLVLPDVQPVGYHAWVTPRLLALFVLGSPNALVVADMRSGTIDTLARNIGRSLVPLRGAEAFSFVQLAAGQPATLVVAARAANGQWRLRSLVALPEGSEYVAWIGPGTLLTTQGSRVLLWREQEPRVWTELADLAAGGVRGLSRLAVSADLRWIALVGQGN